MVKCSGLREIAIVVVLGVAAFGGWLVGTLARGILW